MLFYDSVCSVKALELSTKSFLCVNVNRRSTSKFLSVTKAFSSLTVFWGIACGNIVFFFLKLTLYIKIYLYLFFFFYFKNALSNDNLVSSVSLGWSNK